MYRVINFVEINCVLDVLRYQKQQNSSGCHIVITIIAFFSLDELPCVVTSTSYTLMLAHCTLLFWLSYYLAEV